MEQEFYHYDDRKEFGKTASRCSIALILYVALQYSMVFSLAFATTIAEKVSGGSLDFHFLLSGNNAEIFLSVVTALLSFFNYIKCEIQQDTVPLYNTKGFKLI